jgi:hypothetical protein
MTMRELDRLTCIQGLIDGQLKQNAVATRLGLTTRQVRRLVRLKAAHRLLASGTLPRDVAADLGVSVRFGPSDSQAAARRKPKRG